MPKINTQPNDRKGPYWGLLNQIIDPEIGIGIVDLGLIYKIDVNEEGEANVTMTLTSPNCPVGPVLVQQVQDKMIIQPKITSAEVKLVWEPRWTNQMIDEEIRAMML